ncbi:O-antigen ligase family protein [Pelagibacterium montanilacus]|uniref:O-antigen ligase family protein n=1 Tax=Pelagibacterium montanilacus TaxID=2185280 RepID=UPI000F8F0AE2|nr:O-antigen ligase family protein [Pelagibacterium montanilacus]
MRIARADYYAGLLWALLLACLIGTYPLAERTALAMMGNAAEGDPVRQLLFSALLAAAILPLLWRAPLSIITATPAMVWLFFAWCLVTLGFSAAPGVGLRRLALTIIIVAVAMIAAAHMPRSRVLDILCRSLAGITILGLLAALLWPERAIHQPGDTEAVAGAVRGLFYHKNLFGAVAGMALLAMLARVRIRPGLPGALAVVLCGLALIVSQAKAPQGLVVALVPLTLVLGHIARTRSVARLARTTLVGGAAMWFLAVLALTMMLADPDASRGGLTGRTDLWAALLPGLLESPLAGSGFGSLFQAGTLLPGEGWIAHAPHAHGGYLEIALSTGLVGLVLALSALASVLWRGLGALGRADPPSATIALVLAGFTLALNLLETALFDRANPVWIVLLVVLATCAAAARQNQTYRSRMLDHHGVPAR